MGKCTPRTRSAPQPEQELILGQFLLGGLEVYLDGLWRRQLKKVVNFFGKKVHPPRDKILATPMQKNRCMKCYNNNPLYYG